MRRSLFAHGLCLSSLLLLGACGTLDPMPMGRGYSSYHQPYKSVEGVPARGVGYDFSVESNQAVVEDMRYAAIDLVEKLDEKLSYVSQDIYLESPAHTAFYNGFDHVLREELTQRGYVLTTSPDEALRITFVAQNPDRMETATYDVKKSRNGVTLEKVGDVPYADLHLALALNVTNGASSDYVDGLYHVPLYDFKPAGHVKLKVGSPCTGAMKKATCTECGKPSCCGAAKAEDAKPCSMGMKDKPCTDSAKPCEKECEKKKKKCMKQDDQPCPSKMTDAVAVEGIAAPVPLTNEEGE